MTLTHPDLSDSTIIQLEDKFKNLEDQLSSTIIKCLLSFISITGSFLALIVCIILSNKTYKGYVITFSIFFLITSSITYIKCKRKLRMLKGEKNEFLAQYKNEILETNKINHSVEDGLYFYRD